MHYIPMWILPAILWSARPVSGVAIPAADCCEVFLRAMASRISRELMILAYDWDPKVDE
jgi:hypothetical protein